MTADLCQNCDKPRYEHLGGVHPGDIEYCPDGNGTHYVPVEPHMTGPCQNPECDMQERWGFIATEPCRFDGDPCTAFVPAEPLCATCVNENIVCVPPDDRNPRDCAFYTPGPEPRPVIGPGVLPKREPSAEEQAAQDLDEPARLWAAQDAVEARPTAEGKCEHRTFANIWPHLTQCQDCRQVYKRSGVTTLYKLVLANAVVLSADVVAQVRLDLREVEEHLRSWHHYGLADQLKHARALLPEKKNDDEH